MASIAKLQNSAMPIKARIETAKLILETPSFLPHKTQKIVSFLTSTIYESRRKQDISNSDVKLCWKLLCEIAESDVDENLDLPTAFLQSLPDEIEIPELTELVIKFASDVFFRKCFTRLNVFTFPTKMTLLRCILERATSLPSDLTVPILEYLIAKLPLDIEELNFDAIALLPIPVVAPLLNMKISDGIIRKVVDGTLEFILQSLLNTRGIILPQRRLQEDKDKELFSRGRCTADFFRLLNTYLRKSKLQDESDAEYSSKKTGYFKFLAALLKRAFVVCDVELKPMVLFNRLLELPSTARLNTNQEIECWSYLLQVVVDNLNEHLDTGNSRMKEGLVKRLLESGRNMDRNSYICLSLLIDFDHQVVEVSLNSILLLFWQNTTMETSDVYEDFMCNLVKLFQNLRKMQRFFRSCCEATLKSPNSPKSLPVRAQKELIRIVSEMDPLTTVNLLSDLLKQLTDICASKANKTHSKLPYITELTCLFMRAMKLYDNSVAQNTKEMLRTGLQPISTLIPLLLKSGGSTPSLQIYSCYHSIVHMINKYTNLDVQIDDSVIDVAMLNKVAKKALVKPSCLQRYAAALHLMDNLTVDNEGGRNVKVFEMLTKCIAYSRTSMPSAMQNEHAQWDEGLETLSVSNFPTAIIRAVLERSTVVCLASLESEDVIRKLFSEMLITVASMPPVKSVGDSSTLASPAAVVEQFLTDVYFPDLSKLHSPFVLAVLDAVVSSLPADEDGTDGSEPPSKKKKKEQSISLRSTIMALQDLLSASDSHDPVHTKEFSKQLKTLLSSHPSSLPDGQVEQLLYVSSYLLHVPCEMLSTTDEFAIDIVKLVVLKLITEKGYEPKNMGSYHKLLLQRASKGWISLDASMLWPMLHSVCTLDVLRSLMSNYVPLYLGSKKLKHLQSFIVHPNFTDFPQEDMLMHVVYHGLMMNSNTPSRIYAVNSCTYMISGVVQEPDEMVQTALMWKCVLRFFQLQIDDIKMEEMETLTQYAMDKYTEQADCSIRVQLLKLVTHLTPLISPPLSLLDLHESATNQEEEIYGIYLKSAICRAHTNVGMAFLDGKTKQLKAFALSNGLLPTEKETNSFHSCLRLWKLLFSYDFTSFNIPKHTGKIFNSKCDKSLFTINWLVGGACVLTRNQDATDHSTVAYESISALLETSIVRLKMFKVYAPASLPDLLETLQLLDITSDSVCLFKHPVAATQLLSSLTTFLQLVIWNEKSEMFMPLSIIPLIGSILKWVVILSDQNQVKTHSVSVEESELQLYKCCNEITKLLTCLVDRPDAKNDRELLFILSEYLETFANTILLPKVKKHLVVSMMPLLKSLEHGLEKYMYAVLKPAQARVLSYFVKQYQSHQKFRGEV